MNQIDLACTLACGTVLGALTFVGSATARHMSGGSIAQEDAKQMQGVHQSMLLFSCNDPTGALPTPGRINTWTDQWQGSVPGFGPESKGKNSSGNLYSALIAQEYIQTGDIISPAEAATNVVEYNGVDGQGYEYEMYNPAADTYWAGDVADPANDFGGNGPQFRPNDMFKVKINRPLLHGACYTSYAHLMLCGERKVRNWRVDAGSNTPILSTRGPKNGATSGDEYTRSATLLFFEPYDAWQGNIVFGDGHVEFVDTFTPQGVTYACNDGKDQPDNIFDKEFDACVIGPSNNGWQAGDTWLALNETIVNQGTHEGRSWRAIALYDLLAD